MDELNYIGQLFRDKLKGQTIEPSDKVWTNIQKNIGSSPAIKPKAKFAKYIISGAAAVAIVATTIAIAYFVKPEQKNITSAPQVKLQPVTNNSVQTPKQETATNSNSTNYSPMTLSNSRSMVVSDPVKMSSNQSVNTPLIDNKVTNTQTNTTSPISFIDNSQVKSNTNQPNNITPAIKPIDFSDEHPKTNITLDISKDTTVCIGEPFTLKVKGGNSIIWSTGSNAEEISISALTDEQVYIYRAFVHTLIGDTSIIIRVNAVECHPYEQPNAFTPNGDGINDLFIPNVPSDCSDFSLMIYNRGGVKVFESKAKEKGWDGKFNNEEQKEGAYFYVLQYRPGTSKNVKTVRGTIVLLPRQ